MTRCRYSLRTINSLLSLLHATDKSSSRALSANMLINRRRSAPPVGGTEHSRRRAACHSWASSLPGTLSNPVLLSTDVTVAMAMGLEDGAVYVLYVWVCGRPKGQSWAGSYLSLRGPHHVLLFLQDGIHTLEELHALLWNPAKKREQIDKRSSSLKIKMGVGECMLHCMDTSSDQFNFRICLDANETQQDSVTLVGLCLHTFWRSVCE